MDYEHPIARAYCWGQDLLYRGNSVSLDSLPGGAKIIQRGELIEGIDFGDTNPEDYSNPPIHHGRDGEERLRVMEGGFDRGFMEP